MTGYERRNEIDGGLAAMALRARAGARTGRLDYYPEVWSALRRAAWWEGVKATLTLVALLGTLAALMWGVAG